MAQVKEVSAKGLKQELVITVPKDIVTQNWVKRLEEIGKTAKQPGFRPGKIPMNVLKQRFGEGARAEVLDQTVSEETEKAMTARKLRPALQPKIELVTFAEGQDLEFKVMVEVLPEIKGVDFTTISLEKPVAEVEKKTIDEAIRRAGKSLRKPVTVTEPRATEKGDVVIIDFDGSVDGEARPGMKGEKHSLELGSKSFIDTFEDQLMGLKAGAKKDVKVTFPADYHAKELAGKEALFKVTLHEIQAQSPLEMTDELAKELGFEDFAKLEAKVRTDIQNNYNDISRAVAKRRLMDALSERHTFDVPESMLQNEFNAIWKQVEESRKSGELPPEDKDKSEDDLKKEYQTIAHRRIRLGLVLADLAEKQKIEVSSNDLRAALMAEARRYPGQEKAVIDYYTQTRGALERLRAPLLEEKVVDYLLSLVKVTEKKISADELLKLPETMDA